MLFIYLSCPATTSFPAICGANYPTFVFLYNNKVVFFFVVTFSFFEAPQMEFNLSSSPSVKQRRNPCSGPSPVYQDLSKRHD